MRASGPLSGSILTYKGDEGSPIEFGTETVADGARKLADGSDQLAEGTEGVAVNSPIAELDGGGAGGSKGAAPGQDTAMPQQPDGDRAALATMAIELGVDATLAEVADILHPHLELQLARFRVPEEAVA